jgi:hypothetical protein
MTTYGGRHTASPKPSFLPLAVEAAQTAAATAATTAEPELAGAQVVCQQAEAADAAAAECWTALLAGCNAPARRLLPTRLHELTQATSNYLGSRCWFSPASPHRHRVTGAEARITDAVLDGDGAEFAEAFVGYDHAVATAVASVRSKADNSVRWRTVP